MGLRKEIAHVETKLDQVGSALNDAQKYLRRHNFRIFNALVTEIANKEVFGWTFKYFTHKLGVNIDEKAIDRAHRTGKERGGKVKISIRSAHGIRDFWFSGTEKMAATLSELNLLKQRCFLMTSEI